MNSGGEHLAVGAENKNKSFTLESEQMLFNTSNMTSGFDYFTLTVNTLNIPKTTISKNVKFTNFVHSIFPPALNSILILIC